MKKAIHLFLVASTLAGLTFLHSLNATAGDVAKTLEMPTYVGKIVLTVEQCPKENKHNFNYKAYATEKNTHTGILTVHEGCWNKDVDIVNIWFYNEVPELVATYKDYYFVPSPTL